MKLLKTILKFFFRLSAIAAITYVFFTCEHLILIPPALTVIFLAVWAFSSEDKPV